MKKSTLKKDPSKKASLAVLAEDKAWDKVRGLKPKLQEAADLVFSYFYDKKLGPIAKNAQVTLLLTNDKKIKCLNQSFRGLNKPTNVLSFPHYVLPQLQRFGAVKGPVYLGDIAVSYKYTLDEAKRDNKVLTDHVVHLLIHGLLHLFGYDHLTCGMAMRMENLERKFMAKLGLPDPYEPEIILSFEKVRLRKRKKV